jgi:uncharacterized protein (TIRG00374 family)
MNKKTGDTNSTRSWIWQVFKVILAVGLLGYVITRTNFQQITSMGGRVSFVWLALNFIILIMLAVLKALQYHYITGRRAGYFRVLGIVVVQNALTNLVASTAGIASYITMMGMEKEIRFARATVSFLVVKLADLIAVFILLFASYLWLQPIPDTVWRLLLIICGITLLVLFIFFAALIFRKRFVDLLKAILRVIKIDHWRLVSQTLDLLTSLSEDDLSRILKMLAGSVGFSLVYMTLTLLWGYARLQTFSLFIDFGVVALVTCLLQLASWVPVFILGGLGISESIAIYFYDAFGYNQSEVAAVLLVARLVFYLMNALMLLYIPLEGAVTKHKSSS